MSSYTESRAEQPRASKLGLFDISVGVFFFLFSSFADIYSAVAFVPRVLD